MGDQEVPKAAHGELTGLRENRPTVGRSREGHDAPARIERLVHLFDKQKGGLHPDQST